MKFDFVLLFVSMHAAVCSTQQTCDAACHAAFERMFEIESASWVSQNITTDEFYSTPPNTTGAKPGDLLRWEDIPRETVNTNYTIPPGMSLSRLLYVSEDIEGKPIPASAFVLLPYAKPDPDKPFRTLVWTHGTAGRIRNCAPSNNKNLYYEWQGPFALAQAGYAVVAPDYAGQGSDILQGFMYEAGFLHAADVAFGLIATRKSIGNLLSDEWIVVGHSEGGLTAWRTNERLAMSNQTELRKAGKFLGAVAQAPALRPLDLIPESIRRAAGGPIGDAVSVYFLQSLSKLFPNDIRIEDYVTDIVLGRLALADSGCLLTGRTLFGNLTKDEMYRDVSWLTHPTVVDWQLRFNGAGPHALAAPMLVVQGTADSLTYANNTELDFNRTCTSFPTSSATLLLYPEADHNVVAQVSQADYLKWIKERFEQVHIPKGCKTKISNPATSQFRTVGTVYTGSNM